MTKIISIFNQAGGQGKTTLCFNLGYHLIERGHKVLLVDMDGQASLTRQADLEPKTLTATISDALLGRTELPIYKNKLGFDIVPANGSMYSVDMQLALKEGAPALNLRRALAPITDDYNFIVIDCPPSLAIASANSLLASTHILIPIECSDKGMEGIDTLIGNVQQIVSQGHKNLAFAGVVPMKANPKQIKTREILEDINRYFANFIKVFPAIPKTTDFEHAWGGHIPLAQCSDKKSVIKIIEDITDHLETL